MILIGGTLFWPIWGIEILDPVQVWVALEQETFLGLSGPRPNPKDYLLLPLSIFGKVQEFRPCTRQSGSQKGNGFSVPFACRSYVVCHLRSDTVLSCKCCAALVLLEQDKGCRVSLTVRCLSVPRQGASGCPRFPSPHPAPRSPPSKES